MGRWNIASAFLIACFALPNLLFIPFRSFAGVVGALHE